MRAIAFALVVVLAGAATIVANHILSTSAGAGNDPFAEARAAYDRGDFGTAREHFHVLAELGNARAQTMMGHIYFAPRAVRQNLAIAAHWYDRAAAKGEPNAQHSRAVLGLSDSWFDMAGQARQSLEATVALDLFRKAAAQGLQDSMLMLAEILADDRIAPKFAPRQLRKLQFITMPRVDGIAKDDAESTKWLAQAAEQDDAYAQEFLGLRYLSGASVPREFDKAYFWLSLAARHPDPPDDTNALVRARDLRKALIAQRDKARATLTLEQRKAVEASLMTWRPTPEPDFGTSIHTPSERAAMQ